MAYQMTRTKIIGKPMPKVSTASKKRKVRRQTSKTHKSSEEKKADRRHRRKVRAEEAALKQKQRQRQKERDAARERALQNRKLNTSTRKAKSLIDSATKSIARMQELREQRELRREKRKSITKQRRMSMSTPKMPIGPKASVTYVSDSSPICSCARCTRVM